MEINYTLPNEILNSRCYYLTDHDTLYSFPSNTTRVVWKRSGSQWYKTQTSTSSYGYDWSSYHCIGNTKIEYEYSFIVPIYYFIAFLIAGLAIFMAFKLIIGRLFKGGSKW